MKIETIYANSFKYCCCIDDGTMIAIKTDFFDSKCDIFIEERHFVPTSKYKEVKYKNE